MNQLKISFLLYFAFACFGGYCQNSSERVSPARVETKDVNGTKISINYSSPAVKGRTIWGDLVPYNTVWRTGANEATTIEFEKDVKINNTAIPAGTYALFTLPTDENWTIILNKEARQWGAFNYDKSKDVIRFESKPTKSKEFNENLSFVIEKNTVNLYWENLELGFNIE